MLYLPYTCEEAVGIQVTRWLLGMLWKLFLEKACSLVTQDWIFFCKKRDFNCPVVVYHGVFPHCQFERRLAPCVFLQKTRVEMK